MSPPPTLDRLDEPITGHLRHDALTLNADQTVAESLAALRAGSVGEKIVYFYVVDARGKLVGVVPTRRLLMADPAARVAQIMVDRVVALPESATVHAACELFIRHRFLAMPVVDEQGRLSGVVDLTVFTEEMSDLAERQAADDAFQLIGVKLQSAREHSPWISFRYRFPWLLCNVGGGMACALLIARYEGFLDNAIVVALFIPVVLALSESVSVQSTTITLQSLHHGRGGWSLLSRAMRREFAIAGLLGLACGGFVALIAYAWKREPEVSYALGAAIALSMLTACLLGVALPMGVRALRGDPRIATGPLVLAAADLVTLTLYFALATRLLSPHP